MSEVVVDAVTCLVGAPGHSLWVVGAGCSPPEVSVVVVVVKRIAVFCEKADVRVCVVVAVIDLLDPCGPF